MKDRLTLCVDDLRKCKLFPGSLIDVAIRGDWLSESLLSERGAMAQEAAAMDDATKSEREWANVFRLHGYTGRAKS